MSASSATTSPAHGRKPRVEGEREDEILEATITVLTEVGYDRLSMDAVAAAARASKATLYRRWESKAELVVDAVSRAKGCPGPSAPDTGSLRGDLLSVACGAGGLTEDVPLAVMANLVTAVQRDPELGRAFHERFLGPRVAVARAVFERARARGEVGEHVDLELLWSVLPAVIIHRTCVLAQPVDAAYVEKVVDEVVLPAALRRP